MGSPLRRALSLLLVTAALGRELAPRTVSILPTPGHAGHVVPSEDVSDATSPPAPAQIQLDLCDCYVLPQPVAGTPHASQLTCENEGFFIAGFERAGIFSPGQAHGFPLSSAICCRPCFANSSAAPPDGVGQVISTGCSQSRWDNGGQACPDNTFVAGYASAVLGNPINRYYPVDQATCCRPALLLPNGTVRMLRRCASAGGCFEANVGSGVSCAAQDDPVMLQNSRRLVHGWASVLREPGSTLGASSRIPTAPARCCPVCLDPAEPAVSRPCEASNFCSGHGTCGLGGQCTCDSGWGGLNCGEPGPPSMLQTVTSAPLVVLASLAFALCIAGLAARSASLAASLSAERRAAAAAAAARRSELDAPLLNSSDTDGESEWGSDSDDSVASDAPVEPEDVVGGAAGAATAVAAAAVAGEGEAAAAGISADTQGEEPAVAAAAADDEAVAAPAPARKGHARLAPDCNVCMDARVQIVFLPCGHACACRACARRVRRCPICRMVISRRQKLFLSSAE